MKEKKPKNKTLSTYKKLVVAQKTVQYGKYALPLIPAVTITIVNWNEWFNSAGASLPFGFASLIIALLAALVAYTKRDKLVQQKVSPLFAAAGVLAIFAVSWGFLSNVLKQMAEMFGWVVGGCIATATADQVDMSKLTPTLNIYKQLVKDNNLDKKSKKQQQREEQAAKDAEIEKNRQAVE